MKALLAHSLPNKTDYIKLVSSKVTDFEKGLKLALK